MNQRPQGFAFIQPGVLTTAPLDHRIKCGFQPSYATCQDSILVEPNLFVSRSPSKSKLIYWQLNSQPILPIRSLVPSTRATRRSVSLVRAQTLGNATRLRPFATNDLLRVRASELFVPRTSNRFSLLFPVLFSCPYCLISIP